MSSGDGNSEAGADNAVVTRKVQAQLLKTAIRTGGNVYGLVFEGKGVVLRSMAEVRRWVDRGGGKLGVDPYKRFKTLDAARAWLVGHGVPIVLGWRIDTEREEVSIMEREKEQSAAAGDAATPAKRVPSSSYEATCADLLRMLGEDGGASGAGVSQLRCSLPPPSSCMRRISMTPLERAVNHEAIERRQRAKQRRAGTGGEGGFVQTAGPRAAVSLVDDLRRGDMDEEHESDGEEGEAGGEGQRGRDPRRAPGERALAYSEIEVMVDRYPLFDFTLRLSDGELYTHIHNLTVRKEWLSLSGKRVQQTAALLEALNTDMGSVATVIRTTSLDMVNTLRRYVPRWRQSGGKDAKGKMVSHFGLLDALLQLVEARGMQVKFRDADGLMDKIRERDNAVVNPAGTNRAGGNGSGAGSNGSGAGSGSGVTTS